MLYVKLTWQLLHYSGKCKKLNKYRKLKDFHEQERSPFLLLLEKNQRNFYIRLMILALFDSDSFW